MRCTAHSIAIYHEDQHLHTHTRVPRGKRSTVEEHLLEHRGLTFDEITAMDLDADQVESETVAALRKLQSDRTNGDTWQLGEPEAGAALPAGL